MALRRQQTQEITPAIPEALERYWLARSEHDWATAHGLLLGVIRAVVVMEQSLSSSMAFATLKLILEEEDGRGRA
jgi:hypothetical protein